MTRDIDRENYAELYGPTTGDKVRLGDTELFAEVEDDLRTHGDEAVFGGGCGDVGDGGNDDVLVVGDVFSEYDP